MSLPIQLISTDFDGTIFAEFEDPPIPDELVELIGRLQKRGVKWVINTGRDMSGLMEALARADIPIRPDALVVVEREIYLLQDTRYVGLAEWNEACTQAHAKLFRRISPDLPRLNKWITDRFKATIYQDSYSPLCLLAGNNGEAAAIHAYLNEYCREVPELVVMRNDVYARLSHIGYDKGKALARLSRHWGISRNHVFAAGDHLNDLQMLDLVHARWLATPVNAVPEVLEHVHRQNGFISRRHAGYGVAEALMACLDSAV